MPRQYSVIITLVKPAHLLIGMAAAFVLFAGYEAHAAQGNAAAAALKNPVAATAESVAAGKQTYQRRCASCHGTNGEGSLGNDLIGPAPNLVDAMFTGFPGNSGETVRISIAPEDQSVRRNRGY